MSYQHRRLKGWTRVPATGDKCGARWIHSSSGWIVQHCGHPTANFPYYVITPEGEASGFNTFRHLIEAQEFILLKLWEETLKGVATRVTNET